MSTPIVDSHVHLFPASHLPTLAWYGPNSPLGTQHSVNEYRHAALSVPTSANTPGKYLRGFIFLETDRISSVDDRSGPGWKHALDEVSLLTRIALGEPEPGEGHSAVDKDLCLGIVPWAPVPGGPDVLQKYMAKVKERTKTDNIWRKVCGVRYLVQDKPAGVMLSTEFVDALRWLGREGLAFDLGIDARQGGLHQLREAVEMMDKVYAGTEGNGLNIVINHLCKPNLRILPDSVSTHEEYLEWKNLITKMASASESTYMKLSGAFAELPPLSRKVEPDISDLVSRLQPWTDVVFDAFGCERVMFGSDWPVCNVGGGGNDVSWNRWRRVIEEILERRELTEEQKQGVWGQVAVKAYGVEL
ncbi:amidohydrolase family protein [Penicillium cinerascens]|uniref:Amidohydrolase family protein n=1 Tax=Penicillium cinerascens TaxID=70096 RepID=A0A9W9MMV8_9EURO|nr:amidohydrolase family protein [Penicillium cinerascens]KAJ5204222.1 amidohydrolase family protein [Penicillium cinerascens]